MKHKTETMLITSVAVAIIINLIYPRCVTIAKFALCRLRQYQFKTDHCQAIWSTKTGN